MEIQVPRDRDSSFEPKIVPKRSKDVSEIENKVISMYAKGMSQRDIADTIKDIYGFEMSADTISNITDSNVDVTLSLYQTNGTVIQDDGSASTGVIRGGNYVSGYSDNLTNGSIIMTISAHGTAYLDVVTSSWTTFYGRAEWFQDSSHATAALLISGESQHTNPNTYGYPITVNGGLPF